MALAHAILVALIDSPSSGYDLARRFSGAVGFFWEASHQQIYRELSKLDTEGHVSSETVQQGIRHNKKLYSLTARGKAFLIEWLKIPSSISPIKDDLLVKLFSGYLVAPETLLGELRHHRKQHQLRLTEYQAIEDRLFPDTAALSLEATYPYLTLRNGIQLEQAWLRWCDDAITTLSNLPTEDSP
ncbi:MAG: PadR family transcriptional regulator [Cyanobacteria bacterium J06559_3]